MDLGSPVLIGLGLQTLNANAWWTSRLLNVCLAANIVSKNTGVTYGMVGVALEPSLTIIYL